MGIAVLSTTRTPDKKKQLFLDIGQQHRTVIAEKRETNEVNPTFLSSQAEAMVKF